MRGGVMTNLRIAAIEERRRESKVDEGGGKGQKCQ